MQNKIPNGFVLLSRELLGSKLWSCSDATFKVAIYLILRANYEDGYFKRVLISRGQTALSIQTISNECSLSVKSVRYALKILKEDCFIKIDYPFGAKQGQRITICNYEIYQSIENYRGKAGANEGNDEGNDEGSTIKETKKEKKKKTNDFKQLSESDFRIEVWDKGKEKYDTDMLGDFFRYWIEPDSNGIMKFQLQKTWSTSGRLATWNKNNFNNYKNEDQETTLYSEPQESFNPDCQMFTEEWNK